MDMKEKLVEILKQAPFGCEVLDDLWFEETIARFADHLIAHGVIVLPCKVGDTVYQHDFVRIYAHEVQGVIGPFFDLGPGVVTFGPEAVGSNIFLTREEAEAALKGETDG